MKQNIIMLGLIGLSLAVNAQQKEAVKPTKSSYTINGNITGLKSAYVYIYATGQRDSARVNNGKFSFKSSVMAPTMLYLSDNDQNFSTYLYAENGPVTIIGKASNPESIIVTGGKTQQELNMLNASLKQGNTAITKLYKSLDAAEEAKDAVAIKRIKNEQKTLYATNANISKAFITSHPKSYLSLDRIKSMGYGATYAEMEQCFQSLDPSLRNSERGKKVLADMLVLKRGGNGEKMLNFTQNDMNGKPVSFSSFKGKYVLVDFWASWCGPCRAENPNVLKAYQKYVDKGFTVIGVSLDDSAEKWKKAVEDDKMPWTQLSDLKGWKNEVSTYYGIQGIPSNYLVNPDGVIVARNLRGSDLEEKLAEVLK